MIRPHDRSPSPAPSTIELAWRPMSRKTAFSRTKAIVRQFSRSAIRDCAVCRIGALWPEQQAGDDDGDHAGGVHLLGGDVRRERDHQRQPAVEHRVGQVPAHLGDDEEEDEADDHAAAGGEQEVEADVDRRRTRCPRPPRARCRARPARSRR